MAKSQIFIEPKQTEAGVWFKLVAAQLQGVFESLDFFRAAVHGNEGSTEPLSEVYDVWKELCKEATDNRKDPANMGVEERQWLYEKMAEASVRFYGCSPEVKAPLVSFFDSFQRAKWDASFAKFRKILENSKSGFTCVARPSCYFDPGSSDARPNIIVEPFFSMKVSRPLTDLVVHITLLVLNYKTSHNDPHYLTTESLKLHCRRTWAQAVLSDMILRLGNPENRDTVWKKLEEMGIKFSEECKGLIVDQSRGYRVSKIPRAFAHGAQSEYNKEAFERARHQWTEKWADLFAEKYGRGEQATARYESGGGVRLPSTMMVPDTVAGDVFMWIFLNTHPAPWIKNGKRSRDDPHSRFVRTLGKYCNARWFDDVHKELEEYHRSLLVPGNNHSQEKATKDFEEKIGSLGLSFSPAAIIAITTHLRGSSSRRPGMRWPTDSALKHLASHTFEVDPGKVSSNYATYIKAALGKAADDEACKFCGTCALKPDDNCFFSGAGSLARLEFAIYDGFESGMFFQKTPATTIDNCGDIARRLKSVCRQHKRTPLPALKLLRTTHGRENPE